MVKSQIWGLTDRQQTFPKSETTIYICIVVSAQMWDSFYSDFTWAEWCVKSSAIRLSVPQLVQADSKEITKARCITGRCFPLMANNAESVSKLKDITSSSITVTSQWARWRLQLPASWLFIQPFIQAQIKENTKAPRHWPLWGEFTGDRWIPRTKDQQRGKCFYLLTSSWMIWLSVPVYSNMLSS